MVIKVVTYGDHLRVAWPPPALVIRCRPESDYPPSTLLRSGSLTRGVLDFRAGGGQAESRLQRGWQRDGVEVPQGFQRTTNINVTNDADDNGPED